MVTTTTTRPAIVETPTPASFSISSLSVNPSQVAPGEEAIVTVTVTNTGGSKGDYDVVLFLDGTSKDQKGLSLEPGGNETVSFTLTLMAEGDYTIDIAGNARELTVKAPATTEAQGRVAEVAVEQPNDWWPLASGIAGGLLVAGTLTYVLVWRKRRA